MVQGVSRALWEALRLIHAAIEDFAPQVRLRDEYLRLGRYIKAEALVRELAPLSVEQPKLDKNAAIGPAILVPLAPLLAAAK